MKIVKKYENEEEFENDINEEEGKGFKLDSWNLATCEKEGGTVVCTIVAVYSEVE